MRFSRESLNRIFIALRHAYALCKMCHLQILTTLDPKIYEHVMATEFIAADKKIWGAVSQLQAKGWTPEESIRQMMVFRSDISSLLQPRPKVPKKRPSKRCWQRKNKEQHVQQEQQLVHLGISQQPEGYLAHEIQCRWVQKNRLPLSPWSAHRLQNGRPCVQNHAAKDHRGST